MLGRKVRSGLVETTHRGSVAVVDASGRIIATEGSYRDTFFMRSAAKPFQATVSQALGADLGPEQLAVACSSHSAEPVHMAYVRDMLASMSLGEEDLMCPPDWPMSSTAARRAARSGQVYPRRIFHNCSGKHAAMLRACVAQGWPTAGYSAPGHPLQTAMAQEMAMAIGDEVGPVGVDGCGVPTFRTTVEGMAAAFARLATEDRYRPVADAMHRFPYLTAGSRRPEPALAVAVNAAVKGGAEGCLGVAVIGQVGIAAKAEDGELHAAAVAVTEVLRRMGLTAESSPDFAGIGPRPLLGGGEVVGAFEHALH